MSEFQASNFKKENGGTPDLLGKTTLTSPYFFVPPSGDTASRPESCAPGTLRFNTDIGTLEVYRGDTIGWEQIQKIENQYLGGGGNSADGTGTRGFIMGGNGTPDSTREEIEYLTIETLGNSKDFGDLTYGAQAAHSGLGNRVSAFYAGGSQIPAAQNHINKIVVSSTGNATDYGDLANNRASGGGVSNSIRAIIGGGNINSPVTDVIEYFSMTQSGNAIDFGDLVTARESVTGSINSTTRGLFFGGGDPSTNQIDFITMSTLGNAKDFGDCVQDVSSSAGGGNSVRGLMGGGTGPAPRTNVIQYVTIATTGNTVDFGDLTAIRQALTGMASQTRSLFVGGALTPNPIYNIIDFVEIATTGNAQDFGDISGEDNGGSGTIQNGNSVSNNHGGLL